MEHRITTRTATGRQGNIESHTDKVWFNDEPTEYQVAKVAEMLKNKYSDVSGDGDIVESSKVRTSIEVYHVNTYGRLVKVFKQDSSSVFEMYEDGLFNFDQAINDGFNTDYIDTYEYRQNDAKEQAKSY